MLLPPRHPDFREYIPKNDIRIAEPMDSPLKFGVIGAGAFASRRHIPDILQNEDASLAAVCRRDPEALAQLAAHFQAGRAFADWRAMLDECALDAVVIATPHNLHYEPARAALERGLHVLLEKPMTVRAEEARALRNLANTKRLTLAVALNPPYWAHCHAIRRAIRAGRIGEIESVSFYWTGNSGVVFGDVPMPVDTPGPVHPTLFRADAEACGGGHFMDGGAHLVSEILWVTGLRAVKAACLMDSTPSDRRAALALTFENGAIATIDSIGNSRSGNRRVRNTIGGSSGTITIEGFDFQTTISEDGGEPVTFHEGCLPPVAGPIANLIDAVRGRGALFSDANHGVHVTEVLEAAYESAATGRTVAL